MYRIDLKVQTISVILAILFGVLLVTTHAQQATQSASGSGGSVCVLAYEDANRNATRDPGESLLTSVNVSLMINNNVIIANHVTDGKEPYCFRNVPAQQYTVTFSSPLAQATTLTSFTFPLGVSEQVTKEYGAVSTIATEAAPVSGGIEITTPVRIGISAGGALLAMVFVVAIGMIFYGLFWRRFRR